MTSERTKTIVEAAAVIALVVVALALRATQLGRGFWEDEAVEYTLGAARTFWGSYTYQPFPLYHVFAHIALYFSDQEWVIRVPSLLAGVAGVAVLYAVTRKFFGVPAALAAAVLLTVSTFHISMSAEARFYAMTMLTALLLLWSLYNALERQQRRDWVLYALAGNAATMSHLMLVPLLGSMAGAAALWVIYSDRRGERPVWSRTLKHLVIATALSLVGVAIALLGTGYNLARFIASDAVETSETVVLDDLGNPIGSVETQTLALGEYVGYFSYYLEKPSGGLALFMGVLAVIGIVDLARRHTSAAAMIAASIVLPPLPFFVVTVTHFYHPRYFCAILPFLLLLIAGGLAALAKVARRGMRTLLDKYGRKKVEGHRTRRAALYAAAALPFVVFLIEMAPASARGLNALYTESIARGLHFEFEHRLTTRFLGEAAATTDFAATCFPRPDWRYYYRKNLLYHLNAPVERAKPFYLWYVTGMANCIDTSHFPTHARPVDVIAKDWLGIRRIYRFEIIAHDIRPLFRDADFRSVDPAGPVAGGQLPNYPAGAGTPLRFEVSESGAAARFATNPVPALPHRYMEFFLHASGPPQYALVLKFYDVTGTFLRQETLRMRDVETQREPHPTGDTPPAVSQSGPFQIKLAAASPPLTAYVNAELLIEGDTRAGDVYDVQSATVRGNWPEKVEAADLELSEFGTQRGVVGTWRFLSDRASGKPPIGPSGRSEVVIASGTATPFRIESTEIAVGDLGSLQLEMPISGNAEFIHPSIVFYNARGERLERVQLTSDPVYEWWTARNMLIKPGDDEWSTLLATVRVPPGAARVQVVFDSDDEAIEGGEGTLRIRSPRVYGFG